MIVLSRPEVRNERDLEGMPGMPKRERPKERGESERMGIHEDHKQHKK